MSSSPKIFLTGATGLVGSELSKTLNSKFSKINAIYRNRKLPINEINWINFDISSGSIDALDDALKGTDIIIHNAGSVKNGDNQKELEEIQNINVFFTTKLLEKAVKHKIKKIIYTSSLSAIKKPLPELITESSPIEATSHYSKSKYAGEELIKEYSEKYGINYSIMRISSPVALNLESMPNTVIKKWINCGKEGKAIQVYGLGRRTQDFVSVTDIAQAFLGSIENQKESGIFNIASGNELSMLDLAQIITKKLGNKYELARLDENENDRWNVCIDKAREHLNYKPLFTSSEAINALLNNIES